MLKIYFPTSTKFTHSYACMDYVAFSSARSTPIKTVLFSYDIACSWVVNLNSRQDGFPPHIRLPPETQQLRVAIPDFHVNGHGTPCRTVFNLLRIPSVGRNSMEGIESSWADTNPLSASGREMGPEGRRELLSDHFSYWNHEKIKDIGESIRSNQRLILCRTKRRSCIVNL